MPSGAVNLIGILDPVIGQGKYLRSLESKLRRYAKVNLVDVHQALKGDQFSFIDVNRASLDICVVGMDFIGRGFQEWVKAWQKQTGTRPIVVVPFWELLTLPPKAKDALMAVACQVWAPSRFIRASLDRAIPQCRLSTLPLPMADIITAPYTKEKDVFQVMYNWAGASSRIRKNPDCLLAAWVYSGLSEKKDCVLTLVSDEDTHPAIKNYRWMKRGIRQQDFVGLLHETHVYVSPARAEGIGLGQLEALSQGCRLISGKEVGIYPELNAADPYSYIRWIWGRNVPVSCPQYVDYLGSNADQATWKELDPVIMGAELEHLYNRWMSDKEQFNVSRHTPYLLGHQWNTFNWEALICASLASSQTSEPGTPGAPSVPDNVHCVA